MYQTVHIAHTHTHTHSDILRHRQPEYNCVRLFLSLSLSLCARKNKAKEGSN